MSDVSTLEISSSFQLACCSAFLFLGRLYSPLAPFLDGYPTTLVSPQDTPDTCLASLAIEGGGYRVGENENITSTGAGSCPVHHVPRWTMRPTLIIKEDQCWDCTPSAAEAGVRLSHKPLLSSSPGLALPCPAD